MSNPRVASRTFALLALFTLLMSAFGCQVGDVTAPDPTPERIVTNPDFITILSTPKNGSRPALAEPASKFISARDGGVVANEFVSLDFPPGALDEDTEITIDMPEPDKLIFDFGPDGLKFNKPVVMTVDLSKTDAAGMAEKTETLWYNEEMGWWEPDIKISSEDPNKAKALLEHFSRHTQVGG